MAGRLRAPGGRMAANASGAPLPGYLLAEVDKGGADAVIHPEHLACAARAARATKPGLEPDAGAPQVWGGVQRDVERDLAARTVHTVTKKGRTRVEPRVEPRGGWGGDWGRLPHILKR